MTQITIPIIAAMIDKHACENYRDIENGVEDFISVATEIYEAFRPFEKGCQHQMRLMDVIYCPDCGRPDEWNFNKEMSERNPA